jgi:nicotinamidase-related amidase
MEAKSYSLVVIDMQPEFDAANKPETVEACVEEIKRAKEVEAPIIVVEFDSFGDTHETLQAELDGYNKVHYVLKHQDDGSREVINTIANEDLPSETMRVVGVNTDYCVLETVIGLSESGRIGKIQVIEKACNSNHYHNGGINEMSTLDRVAIL